MEEQIEHGLELEFGGPFSMATAEQLRQVFKSLVASATDESETQQPAIPKVKKKQPLQKVSDIAVRSAMEIADQDLEKAEAEFQQRESELQEAGSFVPNPEQVAQAIANLRNVIQTNNDSDVTFKLNIVDQFDGQILGG